MQNNDCEKFKARLFDYASDMLSETESRELIEHINSCPECRAELAGIKAILSAAAEIENVKPSDEHRRLDEAAGSESEEPPRRPCLLPLAQRWQSAYIRVEYMINL